VDRGIFRFPDFPGWPHEDLIRWALWSCDRRGTIQAVVSHETALSVYDISDLMPAKVHLTVPPAFRKQPPGGCIMHRAILDPKDVVRREGFLITTPLRTILDVADSPLSPEHLEGAIRDALQRGLVWRGRLIEAELPPLARERLLSAMANLGERVA
jgi:predicted transcriptional regulator of viral defense system